MLSIGLRDQLSTPFPSEGHPFDDDKKVNEPINAVKVTPKDLQEKYKIEMTQKVSYFINANNYDNSDTSDSDDIYQKGDTFTLTTV